MRYEGTPRMKMPALHHQVTETIRISSEDEDVKVWKRVQTQEERDEAAKIERRLQKGELK